MEHKESREKESAEGQAPSSDLPGAREVDPAEFNAERKGARKSAAQRLARDLIPGRTPGTLSNAIGVNGHDGL